MDSIVSLQDGVEFPPVVDMCRMGVLEEEPEIKAGYVEVRAEYVRKQLLQLTGKPDWPSPVP